MQLEGSCHCRAVTFSVEAAAPVPFCRCYCEVCRKTGGSGGFGINLAADFTTLKVAGQAHVRVYRARINGAASRAERSFCGECGSALWLWDPRWPDLLHPYAGVIDTDLPVPPVRSHILLASKAPWVPVDLGAGDRVFDGYPDESLAAWHERLGVSG